MCEQDIRNRLAPYTSDGTEAVEAIVTLMASHSRPADPRRAIAKILERFYGGTVHVDAVVSILDGRVS